MGEPFDGLCRDCHEEDATYFFLEDRRIEETGGRSRYTTYLCRSCKDDRMDKTRNPLLGRKVIKRKAERIPTEPPFAEERADA